MLAHNDKGEVLGSWFENCECGSPLATEPLAIQKTLWISQQFSEFRFSVESDCQSAVDLFLNCVACPWEVLTVFA